MPGTNLAAGATSALSHRRAPGESTRSASKFRVFVLAFAVVSLNAAGNLSLAWGMKHTEGVSLNPLGYLRAMLNPYVTLGTILLILWLLTRMALLSWADLSFVLPITGVGYILAAALGYFFLNEGITGMHWTGTLLIFAGTAMVGSTSERTRTMCGVHE